jgi:enamine deaminase RidA (YjgF/YER057c/UK114 family)
LLTALAAAGATRKDVVRLGIYMKLGEDAAGGYRAAAAEVWGKHPTAITVLQVGISNPAFLVEIEAIAFLADEPSAEMLFPICSFCARHPEC